MGDPEIASVIKAARRSAGMSQKELAKTVGTSKSAIAHYELGSHLPTIPVLRRILRAVGMDICVVSIQEPDPEPILEETIQVEWSAIDLDEMPAAPSTQPDGQVSG